MNLLCRLFSVASLFTCCTLASASALDFKANVLDPPLPLTPTFPTYVISSSPFEVSFSPCVADELPGGLTADGCFAGINRTGLGWTGLQFIFPNDSVLASQPVDCSPAASSNVFSQANCVSDASVYTLTFSEGTLNNSELFFLTETGVPALLFPEGVGTALTTTPTPEPSSWMLIGTGLGVLSMAWKRRRGQLKEE